MNCPYCDANVHLMSKFCPKCGLPLKDDITIQGGAYATDDTASQHTTATPGTRDNRS